MLPISCKDDALSRLNAARRQGVENLLEDQQGVLISMFNSLRRGINYCNALGMECSMQYTSVLWYNGFFHVF